jgi:predicted ATPase/DNA-binding SARP family transcriptional activator
MTACLELRFLGLPQIHLDDRLVATDRRKAVALMAYLAVNDSEQAPQKYSREYLSALLWPDYEQAKAFTNLRRTIWEVHQAIGESWLLADREFIRLAPAAGIDLDVAHFQDLLARSRQQDDPTLRISQLIDAAKLYRNHFLTGFSLKDAPEFNEWVFAESEDLRRQLAGALQALSEVYCGLGQADLAVPYARRLITLDPLDESAHRTLMEVYIQAGQHSAALKQYQSLEQLLRKELNFDPQPETRALFKKIRKGEGRSVLVDKLVETCAPKHNLPAQFSTFIGREKEQEEVSSLLAKNRLVTLAGVGGIGKTRLSLQVGHKLLSHTPNGVWFIALDSLSDAALIAQTIAGIFDIREGPDRPIMEILVNVLREKNTLLILDNCEHLLEACAQLATTLLQGCPNLKILATSREILGIPGEAAYYLPSLSIPGTEERSFEKLTEYESIRLFAERAALAVSAFHLSAENARAVADICCRLDGIPLAIELSAARVNILSIKEIYQQLDDSLSLLAGDSHLPVQRQQTLCASVDWSWKLLTPTEQTFMRQLSVFSGGWTLEAAQAVIGGDALNLISALAKKSLILVDQSSSHGTRYGFHEIIRQYAHEKLGEAGEVEKLRTRHLEYFKGLSEEAEPALRGPSQAEWMSRLNNERGNLRLALEWADQTDIEGGMRLISRLHRFWESFDVREESSWLSNFLQKPESNAFPGARAKALYVHGWVLYSLQDLAAVLSAAEECLALARAAADSQTEVDGLILLGINENVPKPKRIESAQQALALARMLGDQWRQALALYYLGWNYEGSERFEYWEQAIPLLRQAGDWRALAHLLSLLSNFLMLDSRIEMAERKLNEAARLNDQLNDRVAKTKLLRASARMARIRGEYNLARKYNQEELEISEELGIRMDSLWCRAQFGYLALDEGNLNEARHHLALTARSFHEDQNDIGVIFSLEGMARLYITVDKPNRAAWLIGWADAAREKTGDPRPQLEQAEVEQTISACVVKLGKAAYSEAYKTGRKMTIEDAMAQALEPA